MEKRFNGTPFENYVDKDIALSYYSDSLVRFNDYYKDGELTITSFNGCTGKFLENSVIYFLNILRNNWAFLEEEIDYLNRIIVYVTGLSTNSYVTIGNFPYITHNYKFLNHIIAVINKKIKEGTNDSDKTMYFDEIKLELVNRFNGKIKIDNHPSLLLQYISLCNYLLFLMSVLPNRMNVENRELLNDKYQEKIDMVRKKMK